MNEPRWVVDARKYIGLRETPGRDTTPTIARWLATLKAWWSDDETPWCGVFVASCFATAGIALPKHWYRAKAWADWGIPLVEPLHGCVVVYERKGGGHVGFAVGRDPLGRILTLGGNQGNMVSVAPFDASRVFAFRWPENEPPSTPLPRVELAGRSSDNEA